MTMLRKKRKSGRKPMATKTKEASIVYLPEELMVEIMLRLPAQTLLRFRCINKSQRRLIGNPDFIKEHLNRSRSDASCYIFLNRLHEKVSFSLISADSKYKSLPDVSALQLDLSRDYSRTGGAAPNLYVLGSENGLVCLHQNMHEIHLWNPSLRQFKTLPYLKPSYEEWLYDVVVKFGFNQVRIGVDDCKVIKMSYICKDFAQVDVYSLNGNSWKSIGGRSLPFELNSWHWFCRRDFVTQVVFNKRIHWIALSETAKDKLVLGYFDMNEEVFGLIPLPAQVPLKCCGWQPVALLDGCLCLIVEGGSLPEVWVMKEYGVLQSWTKLYVIHQSVFETMERPIASTITGGMLIFARKHGKPRKLISYDPRSDKVETILADFEGHPVVYTESLISVSPTTG